MFALLFGGFSEKPEARYASLPSFTEEYAFSLEKDKKGYRIVSTTLTANYRYATRRKSVKTRLSKKHISKSMAVSLRELFRLLIRQIEEPSPDEARRGLDGTTYFFASTDNEGKTAVGRNMVARTRLGARQTRRHLQRSACCRQPVDRRTTRPDRGGIARTNPHAHERPFRQRVTRFGHVPAYRASRPLSQHCRGSGFWRSDGKKPNSSAQSDEAPEKQAARAPEPNVRDRIRPRAGQLRPDMQNFTDARDKPLNQDSIRTATVLRPPAAISESKS